MNIRIETERLILRPFIEDDVERLFLLDSNPEVMKYVGVKPLTQKEQSAEVIKVIQKQYAENGVGRLAVIEKASNLLIGWSFLKYLTDEINGIKDVYDLGYRFLPEFWGKGYATESANASLEYGFKEMNLDKICAHAHSENLASNHTLRKLGFVEKGSFEEPDGTCIWYEKNRKSEVKKV